MNALSGAATKRDNKATSVIKRLVASSPTSPARRRLGHSSKFVLVDGTISGLLAFITICNARTLAFKSQCEASEHATGFDFDVSHTIEY